MKKMMKFIASACCAAVISAAVPVGAEAYPYYGYDDYYSYYSYSYSSSYISQPSDVSFNVGSYGRTSCTVKGVSDLCIAQGGSYDIVLSSYTYSNNTLTLEFRATTAGKAVFELYDESDPDISVRFYVTAKNVSGGKKNTSSGKKNSNKSKDQSNNSNSSRDNDKNNGSSAQEQVFSLVNSEREAAGKKALILDEKLCEAAQARAKELGKSFSHTRPDGSSCFSILDEYGIRYGTAGENIAWGQSTPEEVMKSWMNSSGHKANILSSSYTRIGIGYDPSTNSWVQLFVG